jgi:hypothetical protein
VIFDDEIDAAKSQIEFDQPSAAMKATTTILDTLAGLGLKGLKPYATVMKLVSAQRDENTRYLVEAVILKLNRLESQIRSIDEAHRRWIKETFPGLMVEAISRAEETRSHVRIERLSIIVVQTVMTGPGADLDKADEALRVTVDLNEEDIDILGKMYDEQAKELSRRGFLPELNIANNSWKALQDKFQIFKSGEIYSICSKLQSFGLVTQVSRIPTTLDLTSTPYCILRKGAEYLEAVGVR